MKNTQSFFILSLAFNLVACSHFGARNLASSDRPKAPDFTDPLASSKQVLEDIQVLNPENCLSYLTSLEKKIDELKIPNLSLADLQRDAFEISENSWKIRTGLHQKLENLGKSCTLQAQSNFKQLRFVEDYLLEIHHRIEHKIPSQITFQDQPVPMKEFPSYYSVSLTEAGPIKFEAGDILITRGISFLSSMIARLGDRGSQFSHIVMMDKDVNGGIRTIESYVGSGVAFYDLDYALKNENTRILWVRAKNRELGAKAAAGMGAEVEARLKSGKRIKYDYGLDFNDPSTMSCAEVSQVAFERASGGEFKIPFYPNNISGAESLVKRLKIPVGITYAPGDMELDPRFEIMGEFRDLRLSRDSRQKDAILSVIYKWMDEKGYVLHDNFNSFMAGTVIHTVRKTPLWPMVKSMLKLDDFSKEIPRAMLRTVEIVRSLGEAMQKELKSRDEEFEKKYGLPMSYMDLYQALEDLRQEDLKLYQNKKTRKQSKFHKLFRPKFKDMKESEDPSTSY